MAFQVLGEEKLYVGSLVSLARLSIEAPGGETFEREVVQHPGAVVVVAVADGSVFLVRQYRAAVGACLLELPAGKRDVLGEPPELTARRELEEEVGMRAGHIEELVQFYNSPGFCDEHTYLYLATDLVSGESSPQGVEEGLMTIERVPLDAAMGMVASGEIIDAKTIVGLCLAQGALGGSAVPPHTPHE
jgi:8-oxo-dGTP pyrophosphatase MutT (NUDIX family)